MPGVGRRRGILLSQRHRHTLALEMCAKSWVYKPLTPFIGTFMDLVTVQAE